ncbi:hypothetical protein INR49_000110 [Caranx melampygus]|nr:hypothetical protein INR49_000110 [Caranx melampygus]
MAFQSEQEAAEQVEEHCVDQIFRLMVSGFACVYRNECEGLKVNVRPYMSLMLMFLHRAGRLKGFNITFI